MNEFEYLIQDELEKFVTALSYEKVDKRDIDGNTLLHVATKIGSLGGVEILLDFGADVNLKNNVGDTPLHLAARGNDRDMFQLLLEGGGDLSVKNNSQRTPEHLTGRDLSRIIERYIEDYGYTEKIPKHRRWED
ncbi:hypothetical protein PM10SUCC1_26600 [Propionigenium maris DSM 9537]|uniref:Ankyrin repeat-containing protein n=1 Tax=Propionigenium maris DSM 9537 TaxID=1123000 RepID=A0A9W6GNR5_9FUSO|nr:ankyrin repeat domain-containing protein [Propionigenium maris]GLI57146.1 hypothetical protein PM10SUCC1_26600 [Propionigenium maris DSM 9537]